MTENAIEPALRHVGLHHWAHCGEWRPVATNDVCPACPERCPACGAHYNRREG